MFGEPVSDHYLKFIVNELKPFIDTSYRTLTGQTDTFIMGSSMGGLISLSAVCEYPEVFGGAGCVSTHWVIGDGIAVNYFKEALPAPGEHRFHFDFGTEGVDAPYEPFQLLVDEILRSSGYEYEKDWVTHKYPGAGHNEKFWRDRVHIPLEFLLRPKE
ncbi:MAG: hypothetical protein HC806_08945 [Anaerolineae bacterium]|nr:hypothetical protein [Anaerolineae bacterium]